VQQDSCATIVISASSSNVIAAPTKLFIGVIGTITEQKQGFLADFKRCFNWSGRFAIKYTYLDYAPNKKDSIQKLFKDEYDCALFLTIDDAQKNIEWRLYDTALGTMIQGKRQSLDAYAVVGEIVFALTNEPQAFLSKIAYRKRDRRKGTSSLIVTDFDGKNQKVLLESRRILVSPHWNNDPENLLLVYSEFTPTNVCLKMSDMRGRTAVILDIDGTTAGVSYAPISSDGTGANDVVYCHSGDIWHHHYDAKKKKSLHTRIIHEKAVCSSPTLLENGDVIYCSKGTIKKYNAATKTSEVIISGGYCVSPSYSSHAHKVAYSKKVQNQMQIFIFDCGKGTHEQVTFADKNKATRDFHSDKMDPCWAPDGTHLVFCWERHDKQRIAILDTQTQQYEFITPENEQCSYPTWSVNLF